MWGWVYGVVMGLLGFVFSGSNKTEVHRVVGLGDLDKDHLSGLQDLPKFAIILVLLFCVGCAQSFFGRNTTTSFLMIGAGNYIEIATDELIEVEVQKTDLKPQIEKRNMCGAYVIPKTIYDSLVARQPKVGLSINDATAVLVDSKVEIAEIVIAEPVPTCRIVTSSKVKVLAHDSEGKQFISNKVIKGMIAMSKTTYEGLIKSVK